MNLADVNPLGRRTRAPIARPCRRRARPRPRAADLMAGVAQLAREQLSQRWVATQAAQRGSRRRVLPVDGIPDGAHAGQRAGRAGPAGPGRRGAGAAGARSSRTSSSTRPTPPWATAAWAGWRPVSWIRWPRSACRPSATASATSTACSRRRSSNGRQVEHPDSWLGDGTPWEFPRRGMHLPGALRRLGRPQRRPAASGATPAEVDAKAYDMVVPGHGTAARQHAAAVEGGGAGAHRPACLQQRRLRARRRGQERVREHLLGAVPERQHAGRPRAAAAPGVLLHQRLDPGHRSAATCASTAGWTTWPTRWPST